MSNLYSDVLAKFIKNDVSSFLPFDNKPPLLGDPKRYPHLLLHADQIGEKYEWEFNATATWKTDGYYT